MLTLEQLKARKEGIGGSDSAALFNKSRYAAPIDVYNDKVLDVPQIIKSESKEKKKDEDRNRGHAIESYLLKEYQKKITDEITIMEPNALPFKHHKNHILLANVDGRIKAQKKLIECKTVMSWAPIKKELGEQYTDNIPQEWLMQCAHYGKVFEQDNIDEVIVLVAVVRDNSRTEESVEQILEYSYKPSEVLGAAISKQAIDFWNSHVIPKKPPKGISKRENIIPHEQTKIADSEIYTDYKAACVLLNKKRDLNKQIKELDRDIELYENKIRAYLDEYEYLVDKDYNKLARYYLKTTNYKAQEARITIKPAFKLIGAKDE